MGERPDRLAHRPGEPDLPARRSGGPGLSRRRAPERLPGIVDSHAHLQHARFDADRHDVVSRAVDAGIAHILVPGWDLASSEAALELSARHPGVVAAAVGVHPHHAGEMVEEGWARLEALAREPANRAIGEIGLDWHRNLSSPDAQRDAFARQLALARALDLPVLVHDRDAHADVTNALVTHATQRSPAARATGVLHAFSGDAAMAAALAEAGYLVSFALPVTFRSAAGARDAAVRLPVDRLLVETDAPYLGPERDRRNEPTTVIRVTAELARLRGIDPVALVEPIAAAYRSLVG